MKLKDLDEGLWDGVKDLANVAKAGYAAGRASPGGIKATKAAYQATRDKQPAPQKAKKEKPAKPTNQNFSSYTKLPNGASFISPKGDTYTWGQDQQKWFGPQEIDAKQGLQLFNKAKQKFVPK
jgi:hypothetical protein